MKTSEPVPPLPRAISTPCVQVCIVEPTTGFCLGCKRTLPEIAQWSRFTDARRAEILAALPGRTTPF